MYHEDIDRNLIDLLRRGIDMKEYLDSEMSIIKVSEELNAQLSTVTQGRIACSYKDEKEISKLIQEL